VHRLLRPADAGPRAWGGLDHLCFLARERDDVDRVYEFVLGLGAEIVRAPAEGPWAPGYHSCSFRDSEGIRLELNHVPGKGCSPLAPPSCRTPITRSPAAPDPPLS